MSLAKFQSMQAPAQLLVGARYRVGKKIANGAFGQLRVGVDTSNQAAEKDKEVAIKMEPMDAKIP